MEVLEKVSKWDQSSWLQRERPVATEIKELVLEGRIKI